MAEQPTIRRIRSSVVCQRDFRLLTIRAQDPVTKHEFLILPGGGIEEGEAPDVAALRETMEETGYRVRTIGESIVREYCFTWTGKIYDCRTHFFKAELVDPAAAPAEVNDDVFLLGVEWISLDQIDKSFGYSAEIVDAIRLLL